MKRNILFPVLIAALLGVILAGALLLTPQTAAAPLGDNPQVLSLILAQNSAVETSTAFYLPTRQWRSETTGNFNHAEYFLDVTTPTVNTTTWSLEVSEDGSTWYPYLGESGVQTVTTTSKQYSTLDVVGIYSRIKVDPATTDTFTYSLSAVLTE